MLTATEPQSQRLDSTHRFRFNAMASPCEILIFGLDYPQANTLAQRGIHEVKRLEKKYSRYRKDSLLCNINDAAGEWTAVDAETHILLNFAEQAWTLSDGLFDATSGLLRKVWNFDGGDRVPNSSDIDALLPFIGWEKIERRDHQLKLQKNMELDFGGFVKEYAADRALLMMLSDVSPSTPMLVNLGGDISTNACQHPWRIGIETAGESLFETSTRLKLKGGALATSGDARRFVLRDGVRYCHVLNPKTGWPVFGAPRSVTVHAHSALEAGLLSTIALLQGEQAEAFLSEQKLQYWLQR